MKGLGVDYFWVDAAWLRNPYPSAGNYVLPISRIHDPDRFPRGMKPVSDAVHNAGMRFLLWFEPERVSRGTFLDQEHPEWVLEGGIYNLADPKRGST